MSRLRKNSKSFLKDVDNHPVCSDASVRSETSVPADVERVVWTGRPERLSALYHDTTQRRDLRPPIAPRAPSRAVLVDEITVTTADSKPHRSVLVDVGLMAGERIDTAGCNYVKIFGTPGYRNPSWA